MLKRDIRFVFFQIFAFLTALFPVFTALIGGHLLPVFLIGNMLFMLSGVLLIIFGFMYDRIHKALFSIPIAIVIITHLLTFSLQSSFINIPFAYMGFALILILVLIFAVIALIIDKKELTLAAVIAFGLMIFVIVLSSIFPRFSLMFSWNSTLFLLALIFLFAGMMDEDMGHEGQTIDTTDNIAVNIILSIITFGIYFIIWMYRMEVRIRALKKDDSSLTGVVLCLIFVPFYKIYWFYNREQMFVHTLRQQGQTKDDNSLVYLLLSIFGVSIIAAALMQNDFNRLDAGEGTSFGTGHTTDPGKQKDLALLKEIKTLYEEGVLTEAEYNEKKKQILDRL